jgi:hypothetical protein
MSEPLDLSRLTIVCRRHRHPAANGIFVYPWLSDVQDALAAAALDNGHPASRLLEYLRWQHDAAAEAGAALHAGNGFSPAHAA